ncbi:MAG: GTPase Era [Proteobacteria bacterium]|nr:GTPase Era [Pseudomonadota bacterium]
MNSREEAVTDKISGKSVFKSGFVGIVGAPNAGKSTLLNKILGEKISITSQKPQTTRNRILGVVHRASAQIVFIDTPGIHKAGGLLNEKMVETAISTISDVDLILFMIDAAAPQEKSETLILKTLKSQSKPVILAINKTDLIKKHLLLPLIDKWADQYEFESILPISARHGDQVDILFEKMEQCLPEGPPFYPEDTMTDLTERFIVAEMIREKVFRLTGQEIPYAIAVTIESFSVKNRRTDIHACIHVERDSQKGIIIGKGGAKLKQIGQDARLEIERFLDSKVFLKLFVRVQKNWSQDTRALQKFGY